MTVASTQTLWQYNGNAATTAFAFNAKIFAPTDLSVGLLNGSGGYDPQVNGTDYNVTGVDNDSGGQVVFVVPPPVGVKNVDIRSNIPATQATSIKNQGQFLPELHEEAFDRLTRIVQDIIRKTYTFGIHGPDTETTPWATLPASRQNTAIGFDSNNNLTLLQSIPEGTLSQASIGGFIYPQTAAEAAAGVTPTNYGIKDHEPRRYGAVMDGTTPDDPAWQQFALVISAGGSGYIPPLPSMITQTINIAAPSFKKVSITGYGATLYTTGGIYAIQVTGGYMGGLDLIGLNFNNTTDSLCLGSINLFGAQNCNIIGCWNTLSTTIPCSAGYALVCGNPTDPTDNNTAPFWNRVIRCGTRQPAGVPAYYAPFGVLLIGACNAWEVAQCNFVSTNYHVAMANSTAMGATTTLPNALLIDGNAFEGGVAAILVNGNSLSGSQISGMRIVNNRAETLSSCFLQFLGMTQDSSVPTFMSGNYLIGSVPAYIQNSGAVFPTVNTFDPSITPSYPAPVTFNASFSGGETSGTLTAVWPGLTSTFPVVFSDGSITAGNFINGSTAVTFGWPTSVGISAGAKTAAATVITGRMTDVTSQGPGNFRSLAGDAYNFRASGSYGIGLYSPNTRTAGLRNRAGGGARLDGPGGLWQANIKGISATSTDANNLRGTANFAAGTTVVVNLPVAETDASYFVALSGNAAGYCWVTGKGTSGFAINCSASNSNAVDWMLVR